MPTDTGVGCRLPRAGIRSGGRVSVGGHGASWREDKDILKIDFGDGYKIL